MAAAVKTGGSGPSTGTGTGASNSSSSTNNANSNALPVLSIPCAVSCTLIRWFVTCDERVERGQRLAEFRPLMGAAGAGRNGAGANTHTSSTTILAPIEGKIIALHVKAGDLCPRGKPLCSLECCPHAEFYGGLCTRCGKDFTAATSGHKPEIKTNAVSLSGRSLHWTDAELSRAARDNTNSLLSQRKLLLVLDIDHTLVHATTDPRAANFKGVYSFQLPTPTITGNGSGGSMQQYNGPLGHRHFIKPRAGVDRMLQALKGMFDLHLYTMGIRPYADAVVRAMDPNRELFKNVVTRDDCPDLSFKALQRLHPCDETLVVIVDDRLDVWVGKEKNVIRAHPFKFFQSGFNEVYDRTGGAAAVGVPPPPPQPPKSSSRHSHSHSQSQPHAHSHAPFAAPAPLQRMSGSGAPPPPPPPRGVPPNYMSRIQPNAGMPPPQQPPPERKWMGAVAVTKDRSAIRRKLEADRKAEMLTQQKRNEEILRKKLERSLAAPPATAPPASPAAAASAAVGVTNASTTTSASSSSTSASPPAAVPMSDTALAPPQESMLAPVHQRSPQRPIGARTSSTANKMLPAVPLFGSSAASTTNSSAALAAPTTATASATSAASSGSAAAMDTSAAPTPIPAPVATTDPAAAAAVSTSLDAAATVAVAPAPAPVATAVEPEFEDNVIDSLTAVLQVVHRLFYEPVSLLTASSTAGSADSMPALSAAPAAATPVAPADASSAAARALTLPISYGHHPSVPVLLDGIKSTVLSGVHIVFSSVFPRDHPQPELTEPWKLAVSFGATIHRDLNPSVTHLVAAKPGSEKAHTAKASYPRVKLVHVSWLYHCVAHFVRSPESRFPLLPHQNFHSDEHQIRCLPADELKQVTPEAITARLTNCFNSQADRDRLLGWVSSSTTLDSQSFADDRHTPSASPPAPSPGDSASREREKKRRKTGAAAMDSDNSGGGSGGGGGYHPDTPSPPPMSDGDNADGGPEMIEIVDDDVEARLHPGGSSGGGDSYGIETEEEYMREFENDDDGTDELYEYGAANIDSGMTRTGRTRQPPKPRAFPKSNAAETVKVRKPTKKQLKALAAEAAATAIAEKQRAKRLAEGGVAPSPIRPVPAPAATSTNFMPEIDRKLLAQLRATKHGDGADSPDSMAGDDDNRSGSGSEADAADAADASDSADSFASIPVVPDPNQRHKRSAPAPAPTSTAASTSSSSAAAASSAAAPVPEFTASGRRRIPKRKVDLAATNDANPAADSAPAAAAAAVDPKAAKAKAAYAALQAARFGALSRPAPAPVAAPAKSEAVSASDETDWGDISAGLASGLNA